MLFTLISQALDRWPCASCTIVSDYIQTEVKLTKCSNPNSMYSLCLVLVAMPPYMRSGVVNLKNQLSWKAYICFCRSPMDRRVSENATSQIMPEVLSSPHVKLAA